MTELYAQPYSTEYTGFYFNSTESFDDGMEKLNKCGCEEVEIQFIDGEDHLCTLAKSLPIHQGDIAFWFDELEELDASAITSICFLLDDIGYNIKDALERYEEVYMHHGTAEDYAQELIEETTQIPENLQYYIDYKAVARDMKINGEITEIEHDLIVTNAYEF